ncbi:unnamed protein product [Linum tenue]|uniref:Uncharacterized protein n=1 Tax=Linum tenue TaxID=586396 RepID=A0AAV0IMY2_9ROSI|nr:unnamed protein product [Linum tenue]
MRGGNIMIQGLGETTMQLQDTEITDFIGFSVDLSRRIYL